MQICRKNKHYFNTLRNLSKKSLLHPNNIILPFIMMSMGTNCFMPAKAGEIRESFARNCRLTPHRFSKNRTFVASKLSYDRNDQRQDPSHEDYTLYYINDSGIAADGQLGQRPKL
jgi:hypothetical protein